MNHLQKGLWSRISSKFKDTEKPLPVDWALFALIAATLFVSYIYWDIVATTKHGINLWNALEQGKLLKFYSFNIQAKPDSIFVGPSDAVYDFPMYIPFAIWNLPLWILERFMGVTIYTSTICLIYMKSILLPFLFGSALMIRNICKQIGMGKNRASWAVFIFLSSTFTFAALFVDSQYDIMSIFFVLVGIHLLLKSNMRYFLLAFAIAVAFKLFALLIFIPIILLIEKKVLKILGYCLSAVSLVAFSKFIFMFDSGTHLAGKTYRYLISFIFGNKLPIGQAGFFISIVLIVVLYVFCYQKKAPTNEQLGIWAIYVSFATYAVLLMLNPAHPYWLILMAPFSSILMLQNRGTLKTSMLLETSSSLLMTILQQKEYPWCWDKAMIEPMLLPKIFKPIKQLPGCANVEGLYSMIFPFRDIPPLINSVAIACVAAFLVITFPKQQSAAANKQAEDFVIIERSVVWFRLFAGGVLCAIPALLYFASLIYYR